MYKQIIFSIAFISCPLMGFKFFQDKITLLKNTPAYQKHIEEKENAVSDIETAFVTLTSTGIALVLAIYLADNLGGSEVIRNAYGATIANNFYRGTNLASGSLAAYAGYKGYEGAKHLLDPEHPKPKEK